MRSFELMADVSSNNGFINVANYSRAGHALIGIKATQGTEYVNPFHHDQCSTAHDFGLTVVHYHYCSAPEHLNKEIEHFRHIYNKAWRDGDYACFDIELPILGSQYASNILRNYWLKTQREPILYTYRDFLETHLKGVKIPGGRLWLADYSSHPIHFPQYTLWAHQYTDGVVGPEPHFFTGIGKCDGSKVTKGVARAMYIRKIKTRRKR